MPPRVYRQNKSSGGGRSSGNKSVYTAALPPKSDYEHMLELNAGTAKDEGSWLGKALEAIVSSAPVIGPAAAAGLGLKRHEQDIASIVQKGEDAPVIGPAIGTLGRLFDILSRGNYASANVAQRSIERDDPGFGGFSAAAVLDSILPNDIPGAGILDQIAKADVTAKKAMSAVAGGALIGDVLQATGLKDDGEGGLALREGLKGITGTKKNNYGEVLKGEGVTNPVVRAPTGMALDVLLDPTTYIGGKVVKGPNRADEILGEVDDAIRLAPEPPGPLPPPPPIPGPPPVPPVLGPEFPNGAVREFPNLVRAGEEAPITGPFSILNQAEEVGPSSKFFPRRVEAAPNVQRPISAPVETPSVPPEQGVLDLFGGEPVREPQKFEQRSLFDRRSSTVRNILGDWRPTDGKLSPADYVPEGTGPQGIQGVLNLQPKEEKFKWLQLFDPDVPNFVKKPWKENRGVELLTKVDPEDVANTDLDFARQLDLPSAGEFAPPPIDPNASLDDLAHPLGRLNSAPPFEVGGADDLEKFVNGRSAPAGSPPGKAGKVSWDPSKDGSLRINDPSFDPGNIKPPGSPKGSGWRPVNPNINRGRGYVALRVADNELVKSYKAYEIGRSILRPAIYKGDEPRLLYKAFKLQAHLPDGLDQIMRKAENDRMAHFDVRARKIYETFRELTPEQRREVTLAIDENRNLSNIHVGKKFDSLEEYRQLAKGLLQETHFAEGAMGVGKEGVENYTYRMVGKDADKTLKKLAKETVRDKETGKLHFKAGLQDLVDKGANPELDIADVVLHRISKSARLLARADFENGAVLRTGIPADRVTKDLVEKFNLVNPEVMGRTRTDVFVPEHINNAIKFSNKIMTVDDEAARMGRLIDNAVGKYKFLVTQPNPGHHVRNLIGDIIMNAEDGTWNPSSYGKAMKVLTAKGKIQNREFARAMESAVPEISLPGLERTITVGGKKMNVEDLWDLYVTSGAKSGFQSADLNRVLGELEPGNNPLKKASAWIGNRADEREDFARLAHFIDVMDKGAKGDLIAKGGGITQHARDLADEASTRVRKWNIDYGALTPFERKVVRRIIPFYTFARFNMPRQFELLFTKPGFMALYPKGNNLLQGTFGTENGDDTLLPQWIRENAPFRIQADKQKQKGPLGALVRLFGGQSGQQVLGDVSMAPINDLERLNSVVGPNPLKEIPQRILAESSPAIRIPTELATGQIAYTGQDINGDYWKYARNQIPVARVGNQAVFGGEGLTGGAVARWATGLPIRAITEGQQEGEFRRREDIAQAMFRASMNRHLPEQYKTLDEKKQRAIYRALVQSGNAE